MAKEKPIKLVELVSKDTTLDAEKKREWEAMARLFSSNFKENIMLTSLELDENYGVSMDDWKEFLNYPAIRKYIDSFRNEKMTSQLDEAISKGSAGALKAKEMLSSSKEDNSRLVLFRLPEKVEVFEGEFENGIAG